MNLGQETEKTPFTSSYKIVAPLLLAFFLFKVLWETHAAEENLKTVFIEVAKREEIFQKITFPAIVKPFVLSTVLAEGQGVVDKLTVNLGQRVEEGLPLVSLKQMDPVYKFRPLVMRSPLKGHISQIHVTKGTYVKSGDKLITLTDPAQGKIFIEIPGSDLPHIHIKMQGTYQNHTEGREIPVIIEGLSPTLDPTTGTATATLVPLQTQSEQLLIGSMGKVSFKADLHSGFLLNQEALYYEGLKPYIKTVDPKGLVEKSFVTLGQFYNDKKEILSGLSEKQWVIVKASGFVKPGSSVKIQNAPQVEETHE